MAIATSLAASAFKHRLHWPTNELEAGLQPLPAPLQHYVTHVLRLRAGARLELFDGAGRAAHATLTDGGVQLDQPFDCRETTPHVSVALGLVAPERSDWLVEKLVEVGVKAIHFVHCARSQGALQAAQAQRRLHRWQRLSIAAGSQAERYELPHIAPISSLSHFVAQVDPQAGRFVGALTTTPQHAPRPSLLRQQPRVLVIGPPGGLDVDELQLLQAQGYKPLRLAPFVLRSETAALLGAAALLQFGGEDNHGDASLPTL